MTTARNQTNPAKRIAPGVVTFAKHETLDTTMHTFSNIAGMENNGDYAIAPIREAIARTSFVMTYGDYRNIENFREEATS